MQAGEAPTDFEPAEGWLARGEGEEGKGSERRWWEGGERKEVEGEKRRKEWWGGRWRWRRKKRG